MLTFNRHTSAHAYLVDCTLNQIQNLLKTIKWIYRSAQQKKLFFAFRRGTPLVRKNIFRGEIKIEVAMGKSRPKVSSSGQPRIWQGREIERMPRLTCVSSPMGAHYFSGFVLLWLKYTRVVSKHCDTVYIFNIKQVIQTKRTDVQFVSQ